ncbi:integrase [Asticcacaulis excentricus CB 48]|uniref:Integrase n=1 Tax=Asticcacaulis excentricus (strain ATCC 15261 / DSM 4724 / KCTC 12464 / NCIMB 9791 / VKM B-1370 / CB 48) TaxID=573065 RepID=E8RLJ8_ASTEC|nr:integrase [Asticcacaulis excentricus CB 48]
MRICRLKRGLKALAQPQEKACKISDGNSLYLSVQQSGNRLWQMR